MATWRLKAPEGPGTVLKRMNDQTPTPEYVESSRLAGRRCLIVGAAGGLGGGIARAFAAAGASLAVAARSHERLRAIASTIEAERGSPPIAVAFDVRDAAAVERGVQKAHAALGGLDVVVNAAAIDTGWARAGDMALDIWDDTIAINLSGTYYVCRAALGLLENGSAIVNITSVAGIKAWAEDVAYNASKAGIELLTRTIAVEYAKSGIRANCLAPGVIDGGLTDVVTAPEERDQLVAMHPMARMGLVHEVAEAAVWLASDASSFTTGATLTVDGGFTA
jgi:NAD(P)-dependent dehydrogenase (short-subunit alcohol dehydrogenase family)